VKKDESIDQSQQPWLFQVEPYPEESFGHFLGRFRRANLLSRSLVCPVRSQFSYRIVLGNTIAPSYPRSKGTEAPVSTIRNRREEIENNVDTPMQVGQLADSPLCPMLCRSPLP